MTKPKITLIDKTIAIVGKVILVKANKGGVGKSWITLQLAHALAKLFGKRVIIITSDNQNNIPHFAGIKKSFSKGLEQWIKTGEGDVEKLRENLYYIPLTAININSDEAENFKIFIESLRERFDYIFIDATPVLNLDDVFLQVADQIVIPTFLDDVTTRSIANMLKNTELEKVKAIVPNRATRCKLEKEYYSKLVQAFENESIYISCPISQSAVISRLIEEGKTLFDISKNTSQTFRDIFIKRVEVLK